MSICMPAHWNACRHVCVPTNIPMNRHTYRRTRIHACICPYTPLCEYKPKRYTHPSQIIRVPYSSHTPYYSMHTGSIHPYMTTMGPCTALKVHFFATGRSHKGPHRNPRTVIGQLPYMYTPTHIYIYTHT